MHVIATAGHVDHGKSTLVAALTGRAPDRLAEERRRGLSIELGYVWADLPPVGDVAYVDVPGHERFVPTMLAGVGPVPVVLFVVAADDAWMPQAAEHLAALDGLGVTRGVLAVTRSDLAGPGPAIAAAKAAMSGTGLADLAAVPVAATTGQGLDDLRLALAAVLESTPAADADAPVRLWLDRSFHVRGTGTVVTGTLPAGTLTVGDRLALAGSTGSVLVRVRGLQSLDTPRRSVTGPARVAVDLGGDVDAERGAALLTPDAWPLTDEVDVRLVTGPPGALPREPVLHVGATRAGARVRTLDGAEVRLRLDRPLPLRIGDRALLRDPGSRGVWGVHVLDPAPPPLARRGDGVRRARWLREQDPAALASYLDRDGLVDLDDLARRGVAVPAPDRDRRGRWLLSPTHRDRLARVLLEALVAHDAAHPLDTGLPEAEAARLLALPDRTLLHDLPGVAVTGGRIRRPGDGVPHDVTAAVDALGRELAGSPYAAPTVGRLAELGLTPAVVAAAARAGLVLRLDPGVVLPAGADDSAAAVLATLEQPFSTSRARQALGTSRRVVLPLLAHLDRTGLTVREPDDRRRIRRRGLTPPDGGGSVISSGHGRG